MLHLVYLLCDRIMYDELLLEQVDYSGFWGFLSFVSDSWGRNNKDKSILEYDNTRK